MDKLNINTENLEKSLETYYQAASPSHQFLEKLETQLNIAKNEIEVAKMSPGFFEILENFWFKQPKVRWAYALAAIAPADGGGDVRYRPFERGCSGAELVAVYPWIWICQGRRNPGSYLGSIRNQRWRCGEH
jgi:hypothetical protein